MFKEGYTLKNFAKDLTAGLVVGILSLPMSIAFAVASGARPEQGLYTAVIAGFLAAVFAGSRVQVSGPTGAFIILVADTIARYGYEGLVVATALAGLILIAMGCARFGAALKFIPYPVIVGFTSGIAILIFSSQIKDFTGMHVIEATPTHLVDKWSFYFSQLNHIEGATLAISFFTIGIILLWPTVSKTIPGALVAIVLSTLAVYYFDIKTETIGQRYGAINTSLPTLSLPKLSFDQIADLLSPAIAIALLAGIESLLSAVVADGMTGRRHRSNMELIAQGIGNVGAALCGGIPATGTISRTVANVKLGGHTPVAAIVQSLVVLVVLLFLGAAVSLIPLASLSGILVVIAYNMSQWRQFLQLLRSPVGDVAILLTTFLLTVLGDVVTGIEVGIILSAFIFINRMAESTRTDDLKLLVSEDEDPRDYDAMRELEIPDEIAVYQIYGSLFFGAAEKLKMAIQRISHKPKALVLRMRHLINIDATGLMALHDILDRADQNKTTVILSGVRPELYKALERGGITQRIGPNGFQKNIWDSIAYAKQILAGDKNPR